jgi:hypothetical protein
MDFPARLLLREIAGLLRKTAVLALAVLSLILALMGAVGIITGYRELLRILTLFLAAVVAAIAFTMTFRRRGRRSVAIIGPPGTGKTVLLAGLFYEATSSKRFRIVISEGEEYLRSILSPLLDGLYPPPTSREVFESVSFFISSGRGPFVETVTVSTIDYAGEWLDRFIDSVPTYGMIESHSGRRIKDLLRSADAAVIVCPPDPQKRDAAPMELRYKKIMDAIVHARQIPSWRRLDLPLAIVVTKADLMRSGRAPSDLDMTLLKFDPEEFTRQSKPIFYDMVLSATRPENRFFFGTSIIPRESGRLVTFGLAQILDWLLRET